MASENGHCGPFFITFLSCPRHVTTVCEVSSESYDKFCFKGITLRAGKRTQAIDLGEFN